MDKETYDKLNKAMVIGGQLPPKIVLEEMERYRENERAKLKRKIRSMSNRKLLEEIAFAVIY